MAYQINDAEDDALYDEPFIVRVMYHGIRKKMDYSTGIAGGMPGKKLSETFFYSLLSVPTISGRKGSTSSREEIRSGIRRLKKIGLIEEVGFYTFRLLKATVGGGKGDLVQNTYNQPSTNLQPELAPENPIEYIDLQDTKTIPRRDLNRTNNRYLDTGIQVNIQKENIKEKVPGKRRASKPPCSPEGERLFQEFWNLYPRKEAKKKTLLAWKSKKLAKQWDEIRADLESREWPDNAQFIMLPTTYLNGERWRDSVAQRAEEDAAEQEMMERLSKKLEGKKWD